MQRQAVYKTKRISEHDEQASFFAQALYTYQSRHDFSAMLLFSVPNGMWIGGKNPYALMNKLKSEGLRPGVSDILYLQPRGDYAYLAIEMKAQDKRADKNAVSREQGDFLEAVNFAGGMGEVCYGCEDALKILRVYMSMEAR